MITQLYRRASLETVVNGLTWYDNAYHLAQELAAESGLGLEKCAGIIAATSINQSWQGNVTLAKDAVRGNVRGLKMVVDKVNAILECDGDMDCILTILNGDKVKNFFLNILGDYSGVTIDRWMMRIWGIDRVPKGKAYIKKAAKIKEVATRLGYQPAQLQAILWEQVRIEQSC